MKHICISIFVSATTLAAFGQAKPRQATLAQQKMCADQARRMFNESYSAHGKDGLSYDYTSHYDSQQNICYILVHGSGVLKDSGHPVVTNIVFDAFEGRTYAAYSWINSQSKKYWEVTPIECRVLPRGQEAMNCKSSDEFEALIDKYFGIGR